jgi:hypothetical protein
VKTLLLDVASWDLVVDTAGNIAVAAEPYSYAQDVASAIRLFLGELWYNTAPGVPYFQEILGKAPPVQVFKERLIQAALRVPGVVSAECTIAAFEGRTVKGQVTFVDETGQTGIVAI